MKKLIGAAMLAGAAVAGTSGVASAEVSVSGNVVLTSNYVWRGFQQSSGNLAVQGGADVESDLFYGGVWASSVDFGGLASAELDVYGGFTPTVGPFSLDLGVIGYFYPGSDDSFGDQDFLELYAGGSISPTDALEVGAIVYFSDDFYLESGQATYVEANAAFALSETFSLSGALGNQSFGDLADADYTTWNFGGTVALHGFEFDLRYHDLDVDGADEQISFTVSRAL